MRALLLTLSACAVITTGCSSLSQQPTINTDNIRSVAITYATAKNKTESDIYAQSTALTQKKLTAKGYTVLTDNESPNHLQPDTVLIATIKDVKSHYAVLGTYTKLNMQYELYTQDGRKIFERTYSSDSLPNSQLDDWKIALASDLVTSAYRKVKPPVNQLVDEITDKVAGEFPQK